MQNEGVKTRIVISKSINPWFNLALEEKLVKEAKKGEIILYLWQNADTVVVGKHQNPWKECKCKELEANGGRLARRLSGGGAVFHDIGNLNFTFAMDRKLYDLKKQLSVILNAVKELGINAEFSGRNDILADGRKFSGNAFYFGDKTCYHHGTLLINGNMEKLTKYLTVSKKKIKSKGIESVKSRVVNLKDINPSIALEDIIEALEKSFVQTYGGNREEITFVDESCRELDKLYMKYSSWEFRYGRTPKFDIYLEDRFPWGGIEFYLKLKNAEILEVEIYSDAMDVNFIDEIRNLLVGTPFNREELYKKFDELGNEDHKKQMIEDVKKVFSEI